MSTYDHWKSVQRRSPRAVRITNEFVKALIDQPSKYLVPRFDPGSGQVEGVAASTHNNPHPLNIEIGDWLVSHPTGDIERIDGLVFGDAYEIRD